MQLEWHVPEKSNAIERDRARTYHQAYSALIALHCLERAFVEVRAGRTKSWSDFKVPQDAVSVGFHEAARGVISHHMVIEGGKVANYQPYPPTPWNASVRDSYGTPGPYEDAVQNTPIFEENGPENFKGVDIMRAVRSFDPCLPCGVHMYNGKGTGPKGPAHTDGVELLNPEELIERVQVLQGDLDQIADPRARQTAEELVGAIVELYGEGMRRIVDTLDDAGENAAPIRDAMAEDGVIASLLLIHDLYPVPLDERVMEALDQVRPYLDSHGGGVELLDVTDGVARIRLEGSCKTCPASSATLELAVKQALDEVAPDLEGLIVEGIADSEPEPSTGFDLPVLQVSANGDQEPASKTAQAQAAFNSSNGGAWHALRGSELGRRRPHPVRRGRRCDPGSRAHRRHASRPSRLLPRMQLARHCRHAPRAASSPVPSAAPPTTFPGLGSPPTAARSSIPSRSSPTPAGSGSPCLRPHDRERQRQRRPRPADGKPQTGGPGEWPAGTAAGGYARRLWGQTPKGGRASSRPLGFRGQTPALKQCDVCGHADRS